MGKNRGEHAWWITLQIIVYDQKIGTGRSLQTNSVLNIVVRSNNSRLECVRHGDFVFRKHLSNYTSKMS